MCARGPPKTLNANEQRITESSDTEYTLQCVALAVLYHRLIWIDKSS